MKKRQKKVANKKAKKITTRTLTGKGRRFTAGIEIILKMPDKIFHLKERKMGSAAFADAVVQAEKWVEKNQEVAAA